MPERAYSFALASLPDIPELHEVERLAEEKKVLGFYMSSHPLTRHAGLLQALARLEPYGAGNPHPLFLSGPVRVVGQPSKVGGGERHLRVRFQQERTTIPAIAFGLGGRDAAKQLLERQFRKTKERDTDAAPHL